ncbi:uncharacterized protein LOC135157190 [Lytechinus pictus]|uniref:uncharacterized protein LOC135157190 n=1 Tax=Lytechinus pictus TaxID=7653 RepID=UPI0030B9C48B
MKQRNGPNSQFNRCAVATNGLSSLAFQPFVQSCLTDIACCNQTGGITVSFWLRNGGEDDDQSLPIHVFRSPYLIATLQEDHLVVSCYHGDGTSTKRAEIPRSDWEFATLTCNPDMPEGNDDLKIYINSQEVTATSRGSLDGAKLSLDEFRAANKSFHLLTAGDSESLTSSDIRTIMITDLRVYYAMLSPEDVERVFQHEQDRDLPAKVIRMSTQGHRFISFTGESTEHVLLTCMVRVHTDEAGDEARLRVRFMHTDDVDSGPFEEMTSEDFKMRVYRRRKSGYEVQVKAQILGRSDGADLPQYFTCDVAANSSLGNISNYGFEIINVQSIAEYAEPAYYWTKFFDSGPPNNDGDETEDRSDHQRQANDESYELLCESPAYAECRVKESDVPWYDGNPSFVPQYEFPCDSAGISCESQGDGQTCPDLEVRYACLNTTFENELGESSTGGSDPRSDSDGQMPNSRQPSNGNTQLPNSGQPSNDVIGDSDPDLAPANNDDYPPRPTTTNGITKKPFDIVIRDNLNWIYPVLIVSLGAGIPTLIACYFLCRKKTPEEIKAEILAAEKKKEAEMMKMGPMGASDKP